MIESKERFIGGEYVPGRDGGDYYSGFYVEALRETVEVLREVAKDFAALLEREGMSMSYPADRKALSENLAALPDWILE